MVDFAKVKILEEFIGAIRWETCLLLASFQFVTCNAHYECKSCDG